MIGCRHGAVKGVSSRRAVEGSNATWSCDARILRMRNRCNANSPSPTTPDPVDWITSPESLTALLALTVLEIVLGIDNIVFISILSNKLAASQQRKARLIGLALAMIGRVVLLLSLAWIMRLTAPLFEIFSQVISGRDVILIAGGLFLLGKSTYEIHDKLESPTHGAHEPRAAASFMSVLVQILLLDLVFSLDSVITAVGMAKEVGVMITAIVIAIGVMMVSAEAISRFIDTHPTVKMLALSFLLLIGVALIGEGLDAHIPKGYIYFAMAFSVFVEMLNLRMRRMRRIAAPIRLRDSRLPQALKKATRSETRLSEQGSA